jgi:dienelactone hydrolase
VFIKLGTIMSHALEYRRTIGAIVAGLLLAMPLSVNAAAAEAGASAWKAGKIYVPASLSKSGKACESAIPGECAGEIKNGKHPVIVFMHGCGGPRTPKPFFNLGAIIVAPNSFANGRTCKVPPRALVKLLKSRHGDVAYAAEQVKAAPWADPAKLILAGFSNGAQTTATYPGEEFKARIIIAWTCNNPYAKWENGVRGSGPVLALLGTADEHYKKFKMTGNCGAAVAKRPNSRSIMVPGGGHEIFTDKMTMEAVAKFVPVVIE